MARRDGATHGKECVCVARRDGATQGKECVSVARRDGATHGKECVFGKARWSHIREGSRV